MDRQLVTIQEIKALDSIKDADKIEVATIKGWQVVIKKDEFKVGDKCLYFEIDSFLPIRSEFEFLRKSSYKKFPNNTEGFRLRTCKLRGQISQGLALPLSAFNIKGSIGKDVTDKLKVVKYDPELLGQTHLKRPWIVNKYNQIIWCFKNLFVSKKERSKRSGTFPTNLCPKTDEERIQNIDIGKVIGKVYEVTEKIDGTSATYGHCNDQFYVCSRNQKLGMNPNESGEPTGLFHGAHWKLALRHDLESKLKAHGTDIFLQGEIIGPDIQGNKYNLKDYEFRLFNCWLPTERRYMTSNERLHLVDQLSILHVPLIKQNFEFIPETTTDDIVRMAIGISQLNNIPREGLVFKVMDGSFSFKAINNEFLLKFQE